MRLFIAIEIPEALKETLVLIEQNIKNIPDTSMRLVDPQQLHLTLQFLGDVSEEQLPALKEALAGIQYQSFEVCLGPIGVLPSKEHIRIIYIDLIGENLAELAQQIAQTTITFIKPAHREERDFLAHVTLARVKHVEHPNSVMRTLNDIKIPQLCFTVTSFVLKKSQMSSKGVVHTVLQEYKLVD